LAGAHLTKKKALLCLAFLVIDFRFREAYDIFFYFIPLQTIRACPREFESHYISYREKYIPPTGIEEVEIERQNIDRELGQF
jgi:hypothetical protein